MNIFSIELRRCVFSNHVKISDSRLNSFRTLFSRKELGIVHFENIRKETRQQFRNDEALEQFKRDSPSTFPLLKLDQKRDHLKTFLMVTDGKSYELEVFKSLLKTYHSEYDSTIHKVNPFFFGAPIMRLFYLIDSPDAAVKFLDEMNSDGIFDQQETYKVLLDLLYKHGNYGKIHKLYEKFRNNVEKFDVRPDKTLDCLVFAACYHLNTPEHYEYALKLWQSVKDYNNMQRCADFVAGLALKQKDPKIAIELVGRKGNHVLPRFIRIMAYTQTGEFDEALNVIEQTMKIPNSGFKPTIGKQMVEDLKAAIGESGSETIINRFNKIVDRLNKFQYLSDETLEQHLCKEFPPMQPKNAFKRMERDKKAVDRE